MKNLFTPNYSSLEVLDGLSKIPGRYLDESPVPPLSLLEVIDEYIIRHLFVTCPFKATSEQKAEYGDNGRRCKDLRSHIVESGYTGSFGLIRYGHIIQVLVDPHHENSYDRLTIKCLRDATAMTPCKNIRQDSLKKAAAMTDFTALLLAETIDSTCERSAGSDFCLPAVSCTVAVGQTTTPDGRPAQVTITVETDSSEWLNTNQDEGE